MSDRQTDRPSDQDRDGQYTVKWMSAAGKKLIREAARAADQPIGAYLEETVRLRLSSDRNNRQEGPTIDGMVMAPEIGRQVIVAGGQTDAPVLSIGELDQAVRLYKLLAEMRAQPIKPRAKILISAQRQLTSQITQADRSVPASARKRQP